MIVTPYGHVLYTKMLQIARQQVSCSGVKGAGVALGEELIPEQLH